MVAMPKLSQVHTILWRVLPMLSHIELGNITSIQSLSVSDTSLTTFSEVEAKKMSHFDINNNRYMEWILSNVEEVSGPVVISGNARNLRVQLSHLKLTSNMTLNEVSTIDLSNLQDIDGTLNVFSNRLTSLSLPKLERVGDSLRLADNRFLMNGSFPEIKDVGGGILIVNNTLLRRMDFMPKLVVIGGGLDVYGTIEATLLPSIRFIKGSAKLWTSESNFDCSQWTEGDISEAMRGGVLECTRANQPTERVETSSSCEKNKGGKLGIFLGFVIYLVIEFCR